MKFILLSLLLISFQFSSLQAEQPLQSVLRVSEGSSETDFSFNDYDSASVQGEARVMGRTFDSLADQLSNK